MTSQKTHSILGVASMLAVFGFVSRFVGLFRDRILASHFGASQTLDIYYSAFRIPDFIFNLIITGAITAAFIPVFTRAFRRDNKDGWRIASNFLTSALIAVVALAVIGIISTPYLVRWIAPGFNEAAQILTIRLTRIMFLSPILFGISTVFGAILQSRRRFLAYALAPIAYNLGIIGGIYFLVPIFGLDGLAFGVVAGALLHLLIQMPAVFRAGFRWRFILNTRDRELREIFTLMIPRTFALATSQINFTILSAIASTIAIGSIAIFNLANNIWIAPVSIIGIALPTALFPVMAELSADNQREKLVELLKKTIRKTLWIGLGLTVLTILFSEFGIRMLLGVGKFKVSDIHLTALVVSAFAISIVPYALAQIVNRAFYALHNTFYPVVASIISDVSTIGMAFLFIGYFDDPRLKLISLALAISFGNIIQIIFAWSWFRKFSRS